MTSAEQKEESLSGMLSHILWTCSDDQGHSWFLNDQHLRGLRHKTVIAAERRTVRASRGRSSFGRDLMNS